MKTCYTSLILFLIVPLLTISQETSDNFWNGWSVNVNAGPNLFYGDIEVYNFYPVTKNNNEWRGAYGFIVNKRLSNIFTLRGQFLHGKLSGSKRKYSRWFEADILETSLSLKFDISGLLWGQKQRTISLYAMGGIGLTQWRTELKDMNTDEIISANGNAGAGIGGRTVEGVLPFGMGIDFRLSDKWSLNLEGSLRPVNSDLLDANKGDFQYDFYSYNFIGVSYHFGKKKVKKPIELPPGDDLLVVDDQDNIPQPDEEEIPPVETDEMLEEEIRIIEDRIVETESKTEPYESVWNGVEFRVQILASREIVDSELLSKKFNLREEIRENNAEGWHRYSVGSFSKYWKAKEYKNVLVTRNNIYDAFVVAYREEQRLELSSLIDGERNADTREQSSVEVVSTVYNFRIQILATKDGDLNMDDIAGKYNISEEISIDGTGDWIKFMAGSFENYQEALKYRDQLIRNGIEDAFVVAYKNSTRIPLSEIIDVR
ncbi:MAG: hypothetical protein K8R53_11310 [Bacteroidales bacterium]|nr:hypothetical protein [Bacteroidales bacterium]